ncbi:hypothetical protein V8J82_07920 [Gymnodinialimonas sp. 2305UL16-5]|uniref:hypothetical protein n=1 Tax=Gymnodinialimonas mytili TaxID=3126503 RepID=UPI0030B6245A
MTRIALIIAVAAALTAPIAAQAQSTTAGATDVTVSTNGSAGSNTSSLLIFHASEDD